MKAARLHETIDRERLHITSYRRWEPPVSPKPDDAHGMATPIGHSLLFRRNNPIAARPVIARRDAND